MIALLWFGCAAPLIGLPSFTMMAPGGTSGAVAIGPEVTDVKLEGVDYVNAPLYVKMCFDLSGTAVKPHVEVAPPPPPPPPATKKKKKKRGRKGQRRRGAPSPHLELKRHERQRLPRMLREQLHRRRHLRQKGQLRHGREREAARQPLEQAP